PANDRFRRFRLCSFSCRPRLSAIGYWLSRHGRRHWLSRRARRVMFAIVTLFVAHAAVTQAAAAPLTLDDAIRLALQRNQNLKVSAFSPEIARANVLAEFGRFDPVITFP